MGTHLPRPRRPYEDSVNLKPGLAHRTSSLALLVCNTDSIASHRGSDVARERLFNVETVTAR